MSWESEREQGFKECSQPDWAQREANLSPARGGSPSNPSTTHCPSEVSPHGGAVEMPIKKNRFRSVTWYNVLCKNKLRCQSPRCSRRKDVAGRRKSSFMELCCSWKARSLYSEPRVSCEMLHDGWLAPFVLLLVTAPKNWVSHGYFIFRVLLSFTPWYFSGRSLSNSTLYIPLKQHQVENSQNFSFFLWNPFLMKTLEDYEIISFL